MTQNPKKGEKTSGPEPRSFIMDTLKEESEEKMCY